MRREVHDGLEDVFTPSPMDGVGPREKIYAEEHIMKRKNKIGGKAKSERQRQRATIKFKKKRRSESATSDVCGSGQGEDQGSVQLLRFS